jgi:hypothetical protein
MSMGLCSGHSRGGGSGGVDPATLAARDAALAAQAAAEAAAAGAQEIDDHVTALSATIDSQEAAIEEISGQVTEDANSSNANANAAVAAADLADRMANEVVGVEVLPGKYSGNNYLEATRAAAAIAASFKKRVLVNADFPGGILIINNNHLFRTVELNLTTGVPVVKLPVNLWQVLDENGDPTEAWIRFRMHKDATVFPTFVPDSVPVVLNPAVLATGVFPFAAEPAVASPPHAFTFDVPAGNSRRVCFLLQATYDTPNPAVRNTVLTASGLTGLTKVGADSSSQNYTQGGAICSSLWEAQVTGTSEVAIAGSLTPDGSVLSYVLYALAASNTLSFQATPVNASLTTVDTQHELTLTPVDDKSIAVFLLGHQGNDALPLTAGLGGGTLVASGKTPKSRSSKDISYVAGYDFVATAAAKIYTSTSAKAAKGAVTGVILRPNTAGMVTAVLTAPGGATLPAAGRACTLCIHSDGINYTKED